MPSEAPNIFNIMSEAFKDKNFSELKKLMLISHYAIKNQVLVNAISEECTEIVDFFVKNQARCPRKINEVKFHIYNLLRKGGYNRAIMKILVHGYISMICCDYLEQLYPFVNVTIDDKKISILDRHNKEIPIDAITNTLDSSTAKKFKRAYELLTFSYEYNDEAFAKMFFAEETTKIFGESREHSDNLFIALIQRLLDLLRGICSKSTSRKENKSSFFKELTEYTKYLGIENNINPPEQAQGIRPAP